MATPKGLPVKQRRKNSEAITSNQWQSSPKQERFCEYYLLPSNRDTFGNAYQSAIKAGYSQAYAVQIASPAIGNKWIQEYKKKVKLEPEHIIAGIQAIATSSMNRASDQLQAYKILAQLQGMLVERTQSVQVNIEAALSDLE